MSSTLAVYLGPVNYVVSKHINSVHTKIFTFLARTVSINESCKDFTNAVEGVGRRVTLCVNGLKMFTHRPYIAEDWWEKDQHNKSQLSNQCSYLNPQDQYIGPEYTKYCSCLSLKKFQNVSIENSDLKFMQVVSWIVIHDVTDHKCGK